jgi:hypothetical protein
MGICPQISDHLMHAACLLRRGVPGPKLLDDETYTQDFIDGPVLLTTVEL